MGEVQTHDGSAEKEFFVIYVRKNNNYGINNFADNGNGTMADNATGLMWSENDSEAALNWIDALKWAEDLSYAGYTDWRLPDAKELQSIIDYSRSPDISNSAAIDPVFSCSSISDEGDQVNYPFY